MDFQELAELSEDDHVRRQQQQLFSDNLEYNQGEDSSSNSNDGTGEDEQAVSLDESENYELVEEMYTADVAENNLLCTMKHSVFTKCYYDNRLFRGITLKNRLSVLLVSDPFVNMSSAVMMVHAGNMFDPEGIPGLASLCRRMMFKGSVKYPMDNDFNAYLSRVGGKFYSYTNARNANYVFLTKPNYFNDALDRFAHFFVAPLFPKCSMERNPIDRHHKPKGFLDYYYLHHVNKLLAENQEGNDLSRKHPDNGEIELTNDELHEMLLNFHHKRYSGNTMFLAVQGRDNLDTLETLVQNKFSSITDKKIPKPGCRLNYFSGVSYNKFMYISTIHKMCNLVMAFCVGRPYERDYIAGPEKYIKYLLGLKSKGSIYHELKRLNLCSNVLARFESLRDGFSFLEIEVVLTKQGFLKMRKIIMIVFQYIKMLREWGTDKSSFEEFLKLRLTKFLFRKKGDADKDLLKFVSLLESQKFSDVIMAPYFHNKWNNELVDDLLESLVPKNCLFSVISDQFAENSCSEVHISAKVIKKWKSCPINPNLKMPKPDLNLLDNIHLEPVNYGLTHHPIILLETPEFRLWHKRDDTFFAPRVQVFLNFLTPIVSTGPLAYSFNEMMVQFIKENINERLLITSTMEMRFFLTASAKGIALILDVSNDLIIKAIEIVTTEFIIELLSINAFLNLKTGYINSLKRSPQDLPFKSALKYLNVVLKEKAWTNEDLLDVLQKEIYNDTFNDYLMRFYNTLFTECFIYGSISANTAHIIAYRITHYLNNNRLKKSCSTGVELVRMRDINILPGESYSLDATTKSHKTSCVQLFFIYGLQSTYNNLLMKLLCKVLWQPFLNHFRIEDQVGYVVLIDVQQMNSVVGIRFVVEGYNNPIIMENHIHKFLDNFMLVIQAMPSHEFQRCKEDLIHDFQSSQTTMYEQFTYFYKEINQNTLNFHRPLIEQNALPQITLSDIIACYRNTLYPRRYERRILSIRITSDECKDMVFNDPILSPRDKYGLSNYKAITDMQAFKASKGLCPLVLPSTDIQPKILRQE